MSNIHENDKVCDSALVNNSHLPHSGLPQMAWCDSCGEGCLEIKCPYCERDQKLGDRKTIVITYH